MGVYWLDAEESAAAAVVKSISRGVYDWPSFSMRGFQPGELAALWDVLQDAPGDRTAATGDVLATDVDQGTSVARVSPEFVRRLAALHESDIERVAASWLNCGGVAPVSQEHAASVVSELASFAACSQYEGRSVLQVVDDP